MTYKEKIKELERRIEELKARPIMPCIPILVIIPVVPQPQFPLPLWQDIHSLILVTFPWVCNGE